MLHNSTSIPEELKSLPQWLGYKGTKAPRVAFGNYHLASFTNPDCYTDYQTVLAAVANGHLDGLGVALTEFDPYVVVDLDSCRNPDTGELTEFAQEIVDTLASYTEVSNSGEGLHIVCRSFVDGNYKANEEERLQGNAIEFFSTLGYVILTGNILLQERAKVNNVPRAKLQGLVDRLRMARKQTKTYNRTDPPEPVELPSDSFHAFGSLGPFALLVLNGVEDAALADRFPRDRDGSVDRSKVLFLAAINLRDAGYSVAQAYSLFMESDWVLEYMEEKAEGWLWRYVVEPAFKSLDGEVPVDELPGSRDAQFITQADLVASLRPVDWLIDGVLEAQAIGLLAGKHSAYKSTIAIDWVHAIASGQPWLGHPVRKGSAVVIAGEGARGLARRAHAWGVEHGILGDALAELPVLWSKSAVQIMDPERMGRAVVTIKDMLAERFGSEHPDLVVVDTLNKNFAGGDENSASDIALFFERLTRAFPKSCILVVHHFGKDKNKGSRGSSAIDASLDFLYHAEADGGEIILRSQKMKDADKPAALYLKPEVIELSILEGEDTTTGVTIGKTFRSTFIADTIGVMKNHLQTVATSALAILADMGPATRKEWVGQMLEDEITSELWNKEDRNSWRGQLNKLTQTMEESGLIIENQLDPESTETPTYSAVKL